MCLQTCLLILLLLPWEHMLGSPVVLLGETHRAGLNQTQIQAQLSPAWISQTGAKPPITVVVCYAARADSENYLLCSL